MPQPHAVPRPTPPAAAGRPARPPLGLSLRGLIGLVATLALVYYLFTPDVPAWKLAQAQHEGDRNPQRAMEHVDEALQWDPNNAEALFLRVQLLEQQGDDEAALAAIRDALQVKSLGEAARLSLLQRRIEILQRLGKHQAAINDAGQILAIAAELGGGRQMGQFHNLRAYTIARAAADKQASPAQLAEAVRDMRTAFADLADRRRRTTADAELPLDDWLEEAMYLDTLGYLEFAAGNHGLALRDLNRAIQRCDLLDILLERKTDSGAILTLQERQSLVRMRAVVLHHRGEVLLALGNTPEGERNIQLAKQQGYSRENGNW